MSKRVGGFINQDGLNAPDAPTSVAPSGSVTPVNPVGLIFGGFTADGGS
jgi:hypothetical protein